MSHTKNYKKLLNQQAAHAKLLEKRHVYQPSQEHDACGVGMVACIDGRPKREVVAYALTSLKAIWHRGAVDADGKTGDGAGLRLDIPQEFFKTHVQDTGHIAKEQDAIGVGMVFLPRNDISAQEVCRTAMETELIKSGFQIFGWRQVPINYKILGEKANITRPEIEQIMILVRPEQDKVAVERALYMVRRRIEKSVEAQNINDFYICSLSCYSVVYKGLFLSQDIDNFYPDLQSPQFISRFAIYHQRYSTNTFPSWSLAQPFRVLAHNGEINTLQGNINWMNIYESGLSHENFGKNIDDILPIIPLGTSDSGTLDAVFELFAQAGNELPFVKTILMPEAWKHHKTLKTEHKQFYAFCNSIMDPWDGPAAICASFENWLVCGVDRSGLRPLRYSILKEGIFIAGSEAGMVDIDDSRVSEKGSLDPGHMVAMDLESGKLYKNNQVIDQLFDRHKDHVLDYYHSVLSLDKHFIEVKEDRPIEQEDIICHQRTYCLSFEDLELILTPMLTDAKEALGSMGDDTPLAVLSDNYRSLHHFFRQNFSQVTNPPLDSLREASVMSLSTYFRTSPNILAYQKDSAPLYLESPVLTNGQLKVLLKHLKDVAVIDCVFNAGESKYALRDALQRIQKEAEEAVKLGKHLVLSDLGQNKTLTPIPIILATACVHQHLFNCKIRHHTSINVRSGECLDSHYFAVLLGVGASTVNPYLTQEAIYQATCVKSSVDMSFDQALANYKHAINQGLLKIMGKMGISILSSYRGACNFEAIGLSRALINEFFPGMPARISGIGLYGIEKHAAKAHQNAWKRASNVLDVGGFYVSRFGRGEQHVWTHEVIKTLQKAARENCPKAYDQFRDLITSRSVPIHLRDLLDFKKTNAENSPDTESFETIRQRFLTPGMSLGALSKEAHGTLNVAMNRIGAKSVSGEGGEDPERYKLLPNGDNANSFVKQVASGRFGVTAEYLNQCHEIEIKVAQGAKPGEGGQLPGFKVSAEIAALRHATPGVTLISPPPHHDIYSIEDLAQLIYDLKQINPVARICVKLTARTGIGTIAAGVAKAKADIISVSGYNGGTGASPQTSIKFAGIPWEMGLSETHQVLTMNNLRSQVTLRVDGGLMTGRDIVMAAMLGAEEFGIGTASLVAMGCIMVRQCHSNTCPVGVCTQNEHLRKFFHGAPDYVVNLMNFLAKDVRHILQELGWESFDQIIGRSDLLKQVNRGSGNLDDLDMNPILSHIKLEDVPSFSDRKMRNAVPDTLDAKMIEEASDFFENHSSVILKHKILNTHRTVGTRFASKIVREMKNIALKDDHVQIQLKGSAGQSLGAFCVQGMCIDLIGDANDYVGKGLSGAKIVIRPSQLATFKWFENVIVGNTVLFGATSGTLYAAGLAGERFCVRNSGATAVVEGCGANGCEYMTGGKVVILGEVGNNFAAGMTGGMAYVFDQSGTLLDRCNQDSVLLFRLENDYYINELHATLESYCKDTGSSKVKLILDQWEDMRPHFWHVVPKELLDKLSVPVEMAV